MALVNDKLDKNKLIEVGSSSIQLSSAAFQVNEKISSTLSLSEKVQLTAPHLAEEVEKLLGIKHQPSNQFINSEEKERKRISRELHDGLGQLLTSMSLHVKRCLSGTQENEVTDDHKESLKAISSMVKLAMTEVRTICSAIRPAILDDLGVLAAISWQCRQISGICPNTNVVTDFEVNESRVPEEYKSVIYRIVQESLNNAVKYANAETITVSLLCSHNAIHLLVIDDGIGFDPSKIQGKVGMGLMGMRERAESVQANIRIDADLNQGVQIRVSFPLEKNILNG